ncbi:MAG: hypothetical protein DRP56_06630 [Planctomycetota bacterium]|nr:MAG: hypothetical protein DRP56_06630 [Planctomycetota bacterium]
MEDVIHNKKVTRTGRVKHTDTPGTAVRIFGITCFLAGILASFINVSGGEISIPWGFGRGLLACVFFVTLGSICNILERIDCHIEELKDKSV